MLSPKVDEDQRKYNIITHASQRWENVTPVQIPLWEDENDPDNCVRRVSDIPVWGETPEDDFDTDDDSGVGNASMEDTSLEGQKRTVPRRAPPPGSRTTPEEEEEKEESR